MSHRPGSSFVPSRFVLVLAVALAFSLAALPARAYEKRFTCGGDSDVLGPEEQWYMADVPYEESEDGAGFVGGDARSSGEPRHRFRGHVEPYHSCREGDFAYRFDVPPGDYRVTLGFAEFLVHGPGLRRFDILLEGETVETDLDVFEATGDMWEVLELRYLVHVEDGTLDVEFRPVEGAPFLSAIEVVDAAPEPGPPAPPAAPEVHEGIGAVLLHWAESPDTDLRGYRVYRADDPDGPFERIDTRTSLTPWFLDRDATDGELHWYRVTAVDLEGNESDPSPAVAAMPREEAEATLPVWHLTLDPDDLRELNSHVGSDDYVPACLEHDGITFDGSRTRYRGGIARKFAKKNWKVKLPGGEELDGRDTFNFNSDMWDAFLVRKRLAFRVHRDGGLVTPDVEPVDLFVNGEFHGVVQLVENVDEHFVENHDLDEGAELFKAEWDGNLSRRDDPTEYRRLYSQKNGTAEGYDRLQELIDAINGPQEDLADQIAEHVDLPEFIRYYAGLIFMSEWDSWNHNYYLLWEEDHPRWRFIPWDHDGSWGNSPWDPWSIYTLRAIDEGCMAHPGVGWNHLVDAYLRVWQFRKRHAQALRELMDADWSEDALAPLIDEYTSLVQHDGALDLRKYPWQDNGPLAAAAERLKRYVRERRAELLRQMETWEPSDEYFVYVNEYLVNNVTGHADEAGEHDPWIELYNAGPRDVDVSGMHLSDDPDQPEKWALPDGTVIPAGGFLLVWADGQPDQGPLHASFRLAGNEGKIVLSTRGTGEDNRIVQEATWHAAPADVARGMKDDGLYRWRWYVAPTPGESNAGGTINEPPRIRDTARRPPYPGPADDVLVTARVTDDGGLAAVTLRYRGQFAFWFDVEMFDDGAHGDGEAGDGVYGGTIPAQPAGIEVRYYVRAEDDRGLVTLDPPGGEDGAYSYRVGSPAPPLVINEFMAENESTIADEFGEYEDWVEIHNLGDADVDLTGMHLSDDPDVPNQWRFPVGTVIPAHGYLLVWCDNDIEQGPLHTNFKLSKKGETIGLYDTAERGYWAIDEHSFGKQKDDISEGRWPEGSDEWVAFPNPTPGAANQEPDWPPEIEDTARDPEEPAQHEDVVVTARVTDDHGLARVELYYDAGDGFVATPMHDDGEHGDGAAGDDVYGATIPGQPPGTNVRYYVEAEDTGGHVARDPEDAPDEAYSYRVGYDGPPLFVNEFLADNEDGIVDEAGEHEDWVELWNAGEEPVDLSGMYLTDDLAEPTKWRIPEGTVIEPGGFLLFWCDDDEDQGPLHTNFKLSKKGEEIGLFDTDENGNMQVDARVFGKQRTDVSEGRLPDGGAEWSHFSPPTPERTNALDGTVPGVTATPYNTVVDVTWKPHPDPSVTGYDVLGADSPDGPWEQLNDAPVAGPMLLFRDLGRENGRERWYRVRARAEDGRQSPGGDAVSATPQAGQTTPVTDLLVRREGNDVVLTWTEPTNDPALDRVEVFRDEAPLPDAEVDAGEHLYGEAAEPGRFVDTGAADPAGAPILYYEVRPVDADGLRATD